MGCLRIKLRFHQILSVVLFSFLLVPLLTSAQEANEIPHVTLLFITGEKDLDDSNGLPTTPELINFRIQDLKAQFGTDVVILRGTKNDDFKEGGESWQKHPLLKSGRYIVDGICIESHGRSFYVPPDNVTRRPQDSQERLAWARLQIANRTGAASPPFSIGLTSNKKLQETFGWALKRLSPNAKIIFAACDLLKVGNTPEEKLEIAIRVAQALQIKSGALYLNEGAVNEVLRTRAQENKQGVLSKARTWIGTPFWTVAEATTYNRGFLLKITPNNQETIYRLYRDNFLNARSNRMPAGEVLATIRK